MASSFFLSKVSESFVQLERLLQSSTTTTATTISSDQSSPNPKRNEQALNESQSQTDSTYKQYSHHSSDIPYQKDNDCHIKKSKPWGLDLHYVTDNLIGMEAPRPDLNSQYPSTFQHKSSAPINNSIIRDEKMDRQTESQNQDENETKQSNQIIHENNSSHDIDSDSLLSMESDDENDNNSIIYQVSEKETQNYVNGENYDHIGYNDQMIRNNNNSDEKSPGVKFEDCDDQEIIYRHDHCNNIIIEDGEGLNECTSSNGSHLGSVSGDHDEMLTSSIDLLQVTSGETPTDLRDKNMNNSVVSSQIVHKNKGVEVNLNVDTECNIEDQNEDILDASLCNENGKIIEVNSVEIGEIQQDTTFVHENRGPIHQRDASISTSRPQSPKTTQSITSRKLLFDNSHLLPIPPSDEKDSIFDTFCSPLAVDIDNISMNSMKSKQLLSIALRDKSNHTTASKVISAAASTITFATDNASMNSKTSKKAFSFATQDKNSHTMKSGFDVKGASTTPSIVSNVSKETFLDEIQPGGQTRMSEQIPHLPRGNCPASLSTFLARHHPDHYLIFNLSSTEPSTRTKLLLNNQIVNMPWYCPGNSMSSQDSFEDVSHQANLTYYDTKISPHCPTAASLPTQKCLLEICYAIDAYVKLDPKNTAVIYCSNGTTRTGIAIAAYLKYSHQSPSTIEGFRTFCTKRCHNLVNMEQIDDSIPPSLKTLFRNFDMLIECGCSIQKQSLILRAITLEGIPLDDIPRIDVWDENGLVYSSHSKVNVLNSRKVDDFDDTVTINSGKSTKQSLIWADDDGFYRINKELCSDFLLLCRFGGQHADDTSDPTKVIFRYANNALYLFNGALKLPKRKIDVMRRYTEYLDEEDFLISFLFDRSDCHSTSYESNKFVSMIPLEDKHALHQGWQTISQFHAIKPSIIQDHQESNVLTSELNEYFEVLKRYYHGSLGVESISYAAPNDLLITLALQLSNGNVDIAVDEYLERKMKMLWKDLSKPNLFSLPLHENIPDDIIFRRDIPQCLSPLVTVENDKNVYVETEKVNNKSYEITDDIPTNLHQRVAKTLKNESEDMCENMVNFLQTIERIRFSNDEAVDNNAIITKEDNPIGAQYRYFLNSPNTIPSNGDLAGRLKNHDSRLYKSSVKSGHNHIVTDRPIIPLTLSSSFTQNTNLSHSFTDSSLVSSQYKWFVHRDDRYERIISELNIGGGSSQINSNHYVATEEICEIDAQSFLYHLPDNKIKLDDLLQLMKSLGNTTNKNKILSTAETIKSQDSNSANTKCTYIEMDQIQQSELKSHQTATMEDDKIADRHEGNDHTYDVETNIDTAKSDDLDKAMITLKCDVIPRKDTHDSTRPLAVVIDNEIRDDCKIVAQSSDFYTVQIPVNAVNGGEIVLAEKTLLASAADTAAKALLLDRTQLSLVPITKNQKLDFSTSDAAAAAAEVIAKAKEDKALETESLALKDDPEYATYFNMMTMGLSIDTIKDTMKADGKDPTVMDGDHNKPAIKSLPLKDDPEYKKYFKMLKLGMTIEIIKKALQKDGKDPRIIDLDHNIPAKLQELPDFNQNDMPLKLNPEFAKYFKMLKMGLPVGAVKNALQRDGKDPTIMDLDPNKSFLHQTERQTEGNTISLKKETNLKVRRKKIYWNAIDTSKVKEDSIWAQIDGMVDMRKLDYDSTEFESLFTETLDLSQKKKQITTTSSNPTKQKKSVQVIDGKRGMNGGIILARLKMDFKDLAKIIDHM